jgi:hypothetical protein
MAEWGGGLFFYHTEHTEKAQRSQRRGIHRRRRAVVPRSADFARSDVCGGQSVSGPPRQFRLWAQADGLRRPSLH